jgi:polar amino acid transport system permease protein
VERLAQYFDPAFVWEYREYLIDGLYVTLLLSALTFVLAILPGLFVALGRRFGPPWLAAVLASIVNVCRSVPTVLTVVFIYLALPFAGITLSAFASVLLSLTIMQVVYFSEVFRGGLAAVGKGQFEAAYACGLSRMVVFRKVVLPQGALVAAPAFASSLVLLVQNTSIGSAVALNDLIGSALTVQNISGQPSPLVAAALGYLVIIVPLVRLTRRWERSMAKPT